VRGRGRLSVPGNGHARKSVNYGREKKQENQGISLNDTHGKRSKNRKNGGSVEIMDTPGGVFNENGRKARKTDPRENGEG
jgi:hypothetical protein